MKVIEGRFPDKVIINKSKLKPSDEITQIYREKNEEPSFDQKVSIIVDEIINGGFTIFREKFGQEGDYSISLNYVINELNIKALGIDSAFQQINNDENNEIEFTDNYILDTIKKELSSYKIFISKILEKDNSVKSKK